MKKIWIWISAIFVVAFVCVIGVFLHVSKNAEADVSFAINGTWKVVQYAGDYVNDSYLAFENNELKNYRDGSVYAEDKYSQEGLTVTLGSGKQCSIRVISDNNIVFTEKDTSIEWRLIRTKGIGNVATEGNHEAIIGQWTVQMHGDQYSDNNEYMLFSDTTFEDYRNNDTDAFLISSYSWTSDDLLYIDKMNKSLNVFPISNDTLLLLEEDGIVWELVRKE